MTYLDLLVNQIDRNPDQPRKLFDPAKLQELADSIGALGLLEPVIVRQVDDRYLLVAGERRWRAAQIAGLDTIPARVMVLDEIEAYVLSVAENVNRDDMTVMEEAEAYDQLRRYGKTNTEIAAVFGKRVDMIDARLRLLDLEPHIRTMVEQGAMGARLAWYVAALRPGNQRIVAQRFARGDLDDTSACEFAQALAGAESEVSLLMIHEPTEEDRETHQRAVRKTASMLDQIERLSGLLGDLANADPADLARALGNDVATRQKSIERIARQAQAAHSTLRRARAIAEARTMAVRS